MFEFDQWRMVNIAASPGHFQAFPLSGFSLVLRPSLPPFFWLLAVCKTKKKNQKMSSCALTSYRQKVDIPRTLRDIGLINFMLPFEYSGLQSLDKTL